MFAKLFETKEYGQILVMKVESDDESRARLQCTFQPKIEGIGLAEVSLCFEDDEDESQAKLDKAFLATDLTMATEMVESWLRGIGGIAAELITPDAEG